jgi:carboxyl-terminal processing protease
MKTLRYVCLLLALPVLGVAAEPENPILASFDQVWNTVRQRHWDKQKVGEAWDRARAELRPLAEAAKSAQEVRPILQRLLNVLGESHFAVIPAEAYAQLNGGSLEEAEPAFDIRVLEDQAVVTRGAGDVKSGWILARIGDRDVTALIAKAKAVASSERESKLFGYAVIHRYMKGAPGAAKVMTFLDGENQARDVAVPLAAQPHVVQFGNLPPFAMEVEHRMVEGIAYFRFNAFFEPEFLQQQLSLTVADCGDCKGFILDLRGNMGGIVQLAASTAAWFLPKQDKLGTVISQTGKGNLIVFPRANAYRGRLAVLVDALSVSSAEFLAAGLKDLGRARLFGEPTQGAALPSIVEKLPDGDRFQFAVADYISAAGASVEGAGVTPDVAVRSTRNDYLDGRDPVMDAARQWILSKE